MMAVISLLLLSFLAQNQVSQPLPELKAFLIEFRKTLRTNNLLLSQYTYTEKETRIQLDSDGKPKKTEVKVYEILRGAEPEEIYRRLVSKDGVPVTPQELEKQDRGHRKQREGRERKRRNKSQAELDKARTKEQREEDKIIDDVFAVYDGHISGRETLAGRPVIRLSFKARPGYKPKTREGRIMQKIAGEAWVSEDDYELVRIEAEAVENISVGLGLLGKLNRGSRISAERLKVNDEVWLPSRVEVFVNARVLLLKGFNFRETIEYSDHKRFNVETILSFPDLETPER